MSTLVIANAVLSGLLTLIMALFYLGHKTYPGFGQWTIGGGLIASAFLILMLRGSLPTSVTIVIQNFVYALAAVLYLGGMRSFLGLSSMSHGWYTLPVISGLFSFFSVCCYDSAVLRTLVTSLAFSAPQVMTATYIFKDYPRTKSIFSLVLGAEMVTATVLLLIWAVWSFTISDFQLLMTTSAHIGFFIALMVLQIVITFSFLMLNVERADRELMSAQDALKFSEEKYAKAFHVTPDSITISRVDDGKIIEVNEAFSAISGYSRDEVLSRSAIDLNLWANEQDRNKMVTLLRDTKSVHNQEISFRTKAGKILHCLFSAETLLLNSEVHMLSVIRDISKRKRFEQELQNTLERFYTILSNSFAGLLLISNDGVVEFVNQAMCDLFGIDEPPESLRGVAAREMIGIILGSYEDPEETLGRIKNLVAKNKPVRGTEVAVRGGRTYLVDYVPIVMDGKPYGRLWHHTDITEHKQTEDELRAKTHQLNERLKELNCLYAISRIVEDSKESLDQIVQGVIDIIPPSWQYPEITCSRVIVQDREFKTENYNGPVSKQSAEIIVHGQHMGVLEVGYLEDAPESNEGPFLKEERNLLKAISERLGRIIERKQAENALRESEDKYRRIVDTANEGIWAMDESHVTTFANDAMAGMLGYPVDELLNQRVEYFMFQEDLEEHQHEMNKRHRGIDATYERRLRRKDGTALWTRISAKSILDKHGTFLGSVAMFTDLTQIKSLQSQLLQSQKMQAVGTLAAGIAHDFNNMLQVMLGYSDLLLRRTNKGEPGHRELEKIVKTAFEAKDLVQKIRLFSRKADIQPVPVDLNHQLTELTKLLSHSLLKPLELQVHLGENLGNIQADPALMDQMVTNLAINASEAMPDGGTLTIETQNTLLDDDFCKSHVGVKSGPHVLLSISDTGRGMAKELLDRVFEPFFSTKQRDYHRGTGLGLSIVKGIVDEHGGYITVDSEVGRGTTFKIYFPTLEIQQISQVQVETKNELATTGGETILLVEDEELVRDLGVSVLESAGYRVLAVADGLEALQVYATEKENIALVILDIVMPRMDGRECLQELLKTNPAVKVLISSGVAQEDRVKEVVNLGARGSLLKPYGMKSLLNKVREVIDSE